ncbi:hypothetical protein EMIT0P43_20417 [Pseudomonas jessenii]
MRSMASLKTKCGSGGATIRLARESGVTVTSILDVPPFSRASPLPHWFYAEFKPGFRR